MALAASLLLSGVRHSHARKITDAPSFLDVPAEMQSKSVSTVEGVHFVRRSQLLYVRHIFAGLLRWRDVQPCPADP